MKRRHLLLSLFFGALAFLGTGCGGGGGSSSGGDTNGVTDGEAAIMPNEPNTTVLNLVGAGQVISSENYTVYFSQSASVLQGQKSGTSQTATESGLAGGSTAVANQE